MTLTRRQTATTLAALRYWQRQLIKDQLAILASDEWQQIATDGGKVQPLEAKQIDVLCERINKNGN